MRCSNIQRENLVFDGRKQALSKPPPEVGQHRLLLCETYLNQIDKNFTAPNKIFINIDISP
jgi:hypothetical protein